MGAKHRLQVGSFGSGKSKPLLMEAFFCAMEFPGSNGIILRKTMPDLKRTVIDKFESDIPKEIYEYGSQAKGTYNKSDHIVYWPPRLVDDYDIETGAWVIDPNTRERKKVWRQSKTYFAACEREADVGKYLSTEFVFVGFEELGEFPYLIYDALENRNRCTIPGSVPCMASATNPMGVGWGWIKRLWVDHKPAHGMDPTKYDPEDYDYIHSTVDDNPILIKDKQYVKSLEKSPIRDKIRWGSLDSVSGQYFSNFEEARHVRPASDFIFAPYHPVWVGWDYGFGHYAALVFWTKATLKPRWDGEKPRMVNVMIEELVLHEITPENQAKALISVIPRTLDEDGHDAGYAWDVDSIHFSWERFNATVSKRTVADEVGDILSAAGLPRPTRSNTDRVAGNTKMYSMLEMDDWFILQGKCPTCIESIPLLVRGDGVTCSAEDIVKPKGVSIYDDCADAMRYAVAGVLLDEGQKPREQLLREKLAGIKDPMARAVAAYKNYNQQQAEERRPPREVVVPTWQKRLKNR